MGSLIQKTAEAGKSGFKAIRAFEGTYLGGERITNPFGSTRDNGKPSSDLAEQSFADVVILEMDDNQPAPELKEGKFSFVMTYAPPGVDAPNENTFYIKGWIASFEKQNITPDDCVGKRLKMVRTEVVLFEDKKTMKPVKAENFVLASGNPEEEKKNLMDYARNLVKGLNAPAAARAIARDARTKNNDELKAASRNGQVAQVLGMEEKEGVYVIKEVQQEASQ